ncbi:MAG TPA: MoaD/ThiS family protein [Bacteroidales bacterium]|nr:MoaD/ThiS family protein [Bacteroidales bacterium]
MEIKVLFFGVLTEVTGTCCKHYPASGSYRDLMLRIQDDYPEIVHYNFRVSVNNEIVNSEPVLNDGDEVALLPPFSGG